MSIKINYQDIKKNLSKQLSKSGWDIIDRYLFSKEFQKCLEHLVNDVNNNRRFTPQIKNIFKAFEKCNHDNTNVIFISQDPYPNIIEINNRSITAADGIAFSCSLIKQEQSALSKIFDELEILYPEYQRDVDLSRWSEQGVLLLNKNLTTRINNIGTHYNLWKDFITNIVKYINDNMKDIVFILIGNKAQALQNLINKHHVLTCEHPAAAAYNKRKWNSNNIFINVNNKLKKFNKPEIIW